MPTAQRNLKQVALTSSNALTQDALSTYQSLLRDVADKQQAKFCQMYQECVKNLQAEQAKRQELERDRSYLRQCLDENRDQLYHQDQSLEELTQELCWTRKTLAEKEKRAEEQWAAVINIAAMLRCQNSDNGGQVDVAKLAIEKENLQDECHQLKYSLSQTQQDLLETQTQIISERKRWDSNNQAMYGSLNNCSTKISQLQRTHNYQQALLGQQEKQLTEFRRQAKARETDFHPWNQPSHPPPLVGPVPDKKFRKRQ